MNEKKEKNYIKYIDTYIRRLGDVLHEKKFKSGELDVIIVKLTTKRCLWIF